MGSDPFYLAFGYQSDKDTASNLRKVPEFIANIVSMHLLEKRNFTSINSHTQKTNFRGLV